MVGSQRLPFWSYGSFQCQPVSQYAWGRIEGRGGAEPRLTTAPLGCRMERLRQWLRKKAAEMCP